MPRIALPNAKKNYVTISPRGGDETLLSQDLDSIKTLYKTHGALLFKGFDWGVADFAVFTAKFCTSSAFNESPNRKLIDEQRHIQTVDQGDEEFPLHPELSRTPWKPDVCFFGCQKAPPAGGETVICDGVRIVENLPAKLLRELRSQPLLYQLPASPDMLKYWFGTRLPSAEQLKNPPSNCPFTFTVDNGKVMRTFSAPFLHKPMFHNGDAFGNFILFSWYVHGYLGYPTWMDGSQVELSVVEAIKRVGDRFTVAVKWKRNDLLMIDNTRFLHGRKPVIDVDERLILTFFGYVNFAPKSADDVPNGPWRRRDNIEFFRAHQ